MLPEATGETSAAPDNETDILLVAKRALGTIQRVWDARNSERVGFCGQVTNARQNDVGMLTRAPVELAAQGEADGVRGEKLDCRSRSLVFTGSPEAIVP